MWLAFWNGIVQLTNKILLKCIPEGLTGNKSTLLHLLGAKPLTESMLTKFRLTDTISLHDKLCNNELSHYWFTHLSLVKMAAISHMTDVCKCIFMNEKFCILIRISLNFVPEGPVDNKSVLVQVIIWTNAESVTSLTHIWGTWGRRVKPLTEQLLAYCQ